MKNLFMFWVLFITFATTVFGQTEKTMVKSINLAETHTTYAMLPGAVEVVEWDEDFLRLTTTLKVENMSESIVKRLLIVGRYTVESQVDELGEVMLVKMPKVANLVVVQGVDLLETCTFVIHAPKGYRVIIKNDLNPKHLQKEGGSLEESL